MDRLDYELRLAMKDRLIDDLRATIEREVERRRAAERLVDAAKLRQEHAEFLMRLAAERALTSEAQLRRLEAKLKD